MDSAVRTLMQATLETAATPTRKPGGRRRSKAPTPVASGPPRWKTFLAALRAKLGTRKTWVVVMFALGTADVVLNIVNFIQMSSEDLYYGLVIGPPTYDLWVSMCVFTVFGTLFYIPETINTFSALYSAEGETIIPLHFELPVTLLLEHIPLAATDYFVARCRREVTTEVDSVCGAVRLVFIFLRLVWYAHIEGKKIKINDKYEIRQLLVMACCLLFSVAIAFPIMNWRYEATGKLKFHHLINVSVYMLKREPPPEGRKFNLDLTDILKSQGWSETNTSLVHSAWDIYKAYEKNKTLRAYYNCHHSKPEKPAECLRYGAKFLMFTFEYRPVKTISPYGEIAYNYAEICLDNVSSQSPQSSFSEDSSFQPSDKNCNEATEPLTDGWRLFYFTTTRWHSKRVVRFNVSEPFWKVYTSPMPKYSSRIKMCDNHLIKQLCSNEPTPETDNDAVEDDCPENLHQRFLRRRRRRRR